MRAAGLGRARACPGAAGRAGRARGGPGPGAEALLLRGPATTCLGPARSFPKLQTARLPPPLPTLRHQVEGGGEAKEEKGTKATGE